MQAVPYTFPMHGEQRRSAADFLPRERDLPRLMKAAAGCRGCDLYRNATQTVFGEGSTRAEVMLVGEQPGDREDREGHPFVGPAGWLLDRALREAGIAREKVYVTNAVKHFKWEPRGKRRIHRRPVDSEIEACFPWLAAERELVKPAVVVCLGATAARSVFGRSVRIRDVRGLFLDSRLAPVAMVTTHPAAILRLREDERRHAEFSRFVGELRGITARLHAGH